MKNMRWIFLYGGLIVWMVLGSGARLHAQSPDYGTLFESYKWRSLGPANMGGRVVDIEVVETSPWIIYAAIGPSGVWKSDNNGTTWRPIFEQEATVSVGDIAVCQMRPETVWVGTGEATARNSVTIGDGVYKSMDGGKTWEHMGLRETRHISRILIHPQRPDTVYVAAQGHLWGSNEERGVYKTEDGGKTWEKVLYVNPSTGIADLAIHPTNGEILYAAAWDHRRFPFYFYSGGPGSGLFKTSDGGASWSRLARDLPDGVLGRIGVAVARSEPDVVYALIEHLDGGIWRSPDSGVTWERMCDNETYTQVNFRPFYYSQIRVDPTDADVVYVFSGGSFVSKDGGKKFRLISTGTHSDHHDLWINPANPLHLIDGNDGGIDITYDGGKSWHGIRHMALAEVYQIGYDMAHPYTVYCGLQDNGVWGGPSATLETSGIANSDWFSVGGGDGFYCQPDPSNPRFVYANSQMNGLYRYDRTLRLSKTIKPLAPAGDPPYRFNWNSPILISPHDPKTVYTGGNFLFVSRDMGQSWAVISPDLTTNDPEKQKGSGGMITPDNTGAEIHCTIITIAESPVAPGIIWCGTDDGNVQLTRDTGKTWTSVGENIPGLPANTWCSRIEASRFHKGGAYAAFDGHRHDDYATYLYKTMDFGQTWTDISGDLPFGWVHVIREDLRNPDLLFVGTEFSVYASLDAGGTWFSLRNNLPTTAVRDIAVHPRERDLILGTHGRGVWILDDITALQEFKPDVADSDAYMFDIRPVTRFHLGNTREMFPQGGFSAKNPELGLGIAAYFKDRPPERPQLRIRNSEGQVVFESKLPRKAGLQRFKWNLQFIPRMDDGTPIRSGGAVLVLPPTAPPGEYSVELAVGDLVLSKPGLVHADPRVSFDAEAYALQVKSQIRALILSRRVGLTVTAVLGLRSGLQRLEKALSAQESVPEEVIRAVQTFEAAFLPVEEEVKPKRFGYRLDVETALRGGNLPMRMAFLGMSLGSYPGPPTETDQAQLDEFEETVRDRKVRVNELIREEVVALNQVLELNGLPLLRAPKPVEF